MVIFQQPVRTRWVSAEIFSEANRVRIAEAARGPRMSVIPLRGDLCAIDASFRMERFGGGLSSVQVALVRDHPKADELPAPLRKFFTARSRLAACRSTEYLGSISAAYHDQLGMLIGWPDWATE